MITFYFLGNTTSTQMLGCVLLTPHNVVVFDGGLPADAAQLTTLLRQHGRHHVDAWFFTHPHGDHIGAFTEVRDVTVGTLYHHFPSWEMLYAYGARGDAEKGMWQRMEELCATYPTVQLQQNDTFSFDEAVVSVLRVFAPRIRENAINNSSTVYRIDTPHRSVLLLGDLGAEGGRALQAACPARRLSADYTQLAHHGQGGVDRAFYEYIRPQRCLWATPAWLWENDNGGGPNSGPWKTGETRRWMQELGVTEHIVQKDGTAEIVLFEGE
ncbi:MAG: MBL fold metallo-hydrolase [Clostridia bacterium]|nr:MBL fold metallo-hydrolase [Clostridia bacterium]